MSIFSKEEDFLKNVSSIEFNKLLEDDKKELFDSLVTNYKKLLKQTLRQTNHSDRQNTKLRRIEKRLKKLE